MKAASFIVDYLARRGVSHFFGYQGTMIAHFVDSIERDPRVTNHSCLNEQGAAFAACGLAQRTDRVAVAYATSGPGAVNLMSGVANAYYDSIPVLFITGQLNAYEYTDIPELRQQGFQETDVVSMAAGVTKMACQVRDVRDVPAALEKAYELCLEGRRGPVLLDLPMNVQREDIPDELIAEFEAEQAGAPCVQGSSVDEAVDDILEVLQTARRPVLMVGNGVHDPATREALLGICHERSLPVVTSLIRPLDADDPCNLGYVGSAYGHRWANIVAGTKADALVVLGMTLCPRQVGGKKDTFAPGARVVRVDVDPASLKRRIHSDDTESCHVARVEDVVAGLRRAMDGRADLPDFSAWLALCVDIKEQLAACDRDADWRLPNRVCERLGETLLSDCDSVAVDVGQHMVWAAQSLRTRPGQELLYSGGHGAMGYGLPAAIGAHYATGGPVGCVCGDGAMQMNIQELQWVAREQLPVRVAVMNNQSLGLIVQQQGDFFEGVYAGSVPEFGFSSPRFADVARAYGIPSERVDARRLVDGDVPTPPDGGPFLLEVVYDEATKAYPKTYFGETMYNQRPYVDAGLLARIAAM